MNTETPHHVRQVLSTEDHHSTVSVDIKPTTTLHGLQPCLYGTMKTRGKK